MERMLDNIGKQAVDKYDNTAKGIAEKAFEENHVLLQEEFAKALVSSFACGYYCGKSAKEVLRC